MTKEKIYERMTVQLVQPDPEIPCEFDEGRPCEQLYWNVTAARLRLCTRTGLDFEDRDLLNIIEGLEEIGKFCALKMFDYGRQHAVTDP